MSCRSTVIADFLSKFPNFRHHGNRVWSETNFTYTVKFADPRVSVLADPEICHFPLTLLVVHYRVSLCSKMELVPSCISSVPLHCTLTSDVATSASTFCQSSTAGRVGGVLTMGGRCCRPNNR